MSDQPPAPEPEPETNSVLAGALVTLLERAVRAIEYRALCDAIAAAKVAGCSARSCKNPATRVLKVGQPGRLLPMCDSCGSDAATYKPGERMIDQKMGAHG